MLVKCVASTGAELPPFRSGLFYTTSSEFVLVDMGQTYLVYGMALVSDSALGTLTDSSGVEFVPGAGIAILLAHQFPEEPLFHPQWYPLGAFEVVDPALPNGWEFSVEQDLASQPLVLARWGYPLLVHSNAHFDDLSELDRDALIVFSEEVRRLNKSSS